MLYSTYMFISMYKPSEIECSDGCKHVSMDVRLVSLWGGAGWLPPKNNKGGGDMAYMPPPCVRS